MNSIKKRKEKTKQIAIIFISLTLFISLFWPYAYAIKPAATQTNEKPSKLNLLERQLRTASGIRGSCVGKVETVSLSADEYEKLVESVNNSIYSGFGNAERADSQKELQDADVSLNPGVNEAKNQFITTASGQPMFVFDTMQFSAKPATAETCYLNNIITRGYMSYAAKVDQNVRFCSQYGDGACENGRYNLDGVKKNMERIEKATAVTDHFYGNNGVKDYTNVDWDAVKADYTKLDALKIPLAEVSVDVDSINPTGYHPLNSYNYDAFKSDCETLGVKECIDKFYEKKIGDNSYKIRSTWNIVESNHTDLGLYNSDVTLALPHELASFVKNLKDLSGEETAVLYINIAASAVSIGSMWKAYKAGKMAKQLKNLKSAKKIEDAEDIGELLKTWENGGELTTEEAEAIGKITKRIDNGDSIASILGDDGKMLVNEQKISTDSLLKGVENGDKYEVWVGNTKKVISRDGNLISFSNVDDAGNLVNYDKVGIDTLTDLLKDSSKYNKASPELKEALRLIASGESKGEISTLGSVEELIKNGETTYGGTKVAVLPLIKKGVIEGADAGTASGSFFHAANAARAAAKTSSGLAKAGKLAEFLLFKGVLGFNNFMKIGRIQAYITFAAQMFTQQPEGFYELSSLLFTLRPAKTIVGAEGSYVDIIRTSKQGLLLDKDIFPDNFYTNILNFVGVDLKQITGKQDYTIIKRKITNMGEIVSVVDQETGAESLTASKTPINSITSITPKADSKQRWQIHNLDPDSTIYYAFEDPKAYQKKAQDKYTAMGFIANNVNISAMVSVESDWAKYDATSSFLTGILPSWKDMVIMGGLTSVIMPLTFSGFKPSTARYALTLALAKGMGQTFTSEVVNQQKYGQMVDINKAFESKKRCKYVKDHAMPNIRRLLHAKAALAGINMGLEVADVALAPTGIGAVASMAAQVVVGVADYAVSEQYVKAKEEGLKAMKDCYETKFEFLSWQKIQTTEGQQTEVEQALNTGAIKGFVNNLGANLNAISPEAGKQLQDLGQSIYSSTLTISADPIKGKSIIRLLGTEIYQVHFDKDAEMQWYAKNDCGINLCHETPSGEQKCLTKQGYVLIGEDGKPIFEGPQNQFLAWNNLETYASIPQRVINIAQEDSPLIKIKKDDTGYNQVVTIEDECVKEEVKTELGLGTETNVDEKISNSFGKIETIATENSDLIWFDGNDLAVSFAAEKVCGTGEKTETYAPAQTLRVPKGTIVINKNGKITIQDEKGKDVCTGFDIGDAGAIAFENAMIIKSRGEAKDYNRLDNKEVLHLAIRDLLSFDANDLDKMEISGPCECVKGALGTSCTTENDEQGAYFGFKMQGQLSTDETQQLNSQLDSICFTEGTGQNGEQVTYKDGQLCITQKDGTQDCETITNIDDQGLHTDDGGRWQIEKGPNGPELWKYNSDNIKTGNPIPLMWLNGLGGSMFNNPETGKISIKNEFPFAINPSFHQYGALANGGFATANLPPWGGRSSMQNSNQGGGQRQKPNVIAQLPGLPQNPYWMAIFMITLIASLLVIRTRYSAEEEAKKLTKKNKTLKKQFSKKKE